MRLLALLVSSVYYGLVAVLVLPTVSTKARRQGALVASSAVVVTEIPSDLPGAGDAPDAPLRPLPAPPIIPRSAASQAKGPRLQKLRAAIFLVETVGRDGVVQAYAGVEVEGDAFVKVVDADGVEAYSEENKNYDAERNLTFVSPAIINSIVLCIDAWISWRYAGALRFGIYTTASVGKEKIAGRVKELQLTLPAKPILDLLRVEDFTDANLLPTIKALVIAEYKAQYSRHPNVSGYVTELDGWSDTTWRRFLSQVTWLVAEGDEETCEKRLVASIKNCPFYESAHVGKEQVLASCLLDLFDRKQLATDYSEKFVHRSELALLFKEVAVTRAMRVDPTWKVWEQLPTPADLRNVREKLNASCPSLSASGLSRYQRGTAAALAELEDHAQDKTVLAMRYQIYDACERSIAALAAEAKALSEVELAQRIDDLVKVAMLRVQERAADYNYAVTNETFVRGVVLTLFDSCFLALDVSTS